MNFPKRVRLVEVGPRDGLQNEARAVPTEAPVGPAGLRRNYESVGGTG